MKKHAIAANATAGTLLSGALLLRLFPPGEYRFYPECPIFHFFHVYCPGCGATRALAALTHARFAEALHYNALIVFLLPVLLLYFAVAYRRATRDEEFRWPGIPASLVHAACVFAVVFGILRNMFPLFL